MAFWNNRASEENVQAAPKEKGAWIFKLLSYVAIIGIFVDIAVFALALARAIPFTSTLLMWMAIVAVVCVGALQALPWIKYLIKKENKVISIVNLCFVGLQVILWVTSIVIIISIWNGLKAGNTELGNYAGRINFTRVALFITIQCIVASTVMSTIMRYKKKWIPFQIVNYISILYIDFYLSALMFCFTVTADGLGISRGLYIIANTIVLTLFFIALAYVVLSNSILNGGRRRRRRSLLANTELGGEEETPKAKETTQPSAKERLENLKEMLDQGLITEEEYNEKRADILSKM